MAQNSIKKIAILGAESTGKTTLCVALAKYFETVFVPEYAREYFNDSDIYNYTLEDLVLIAERQLDSEHKLLERANSFLFCDTTLITLKIWAVLEFHQTPNFIEENIDKAPYDHYFITDNSVEWQADEQRQNKFSRDVIFNLNIEEVKKTGIPYTIISGIENERLKMAIESLTSM